MCSWCSCCGDDEDEKKSKYVDSKQPEVKDPPPPVTQSATQKTFGGPVVSSSSPVSRATNKSKSMVTREPNVHPSESKKAFSDMPLVHLSTPTQGAQEVAKKRTQKEEQGEGPQTRFGKQKIEDRRNSASRLSTVASMPSAYSEQREASIIKSKDNKSVPNSAHTTPRADAGPSPSPKSENHEQQSPSDKLSAAATARGQVPGLVP